MTDDEQIGSADYLASAGETFRSRLRLVGAGEWGLVTPCEGWSVRDLTHHVVVGNMRTTHLVGGASREVATALVAGDQLGDDPLAAFDSSQAAQIAAFAGAGAFERPCETAVGTIPGKQLFFFRTNDLVVHAWDLARAIGTDELLDPFVVEQTWRAIRAMVPAVESMGVFGGGPSGTVPDDAPLQLRLLDACGRRP